MSTFGIELDVTVELGAFLSHSAFRSSIVFNGFPTLPMVLSVWYTFCDWGILVLTDSCWCPGRDTLVTTSPSFTISPSYKKFVEGEFVEDSISWHMCLWCLRAKLFAMFLKFFHLRGVKKEFLASKHMHHWCLSGPNPKMCCRRWHIKSILGMKDALGYCSVKPMWYWRIVISSSNAVSVNAMWEVLRYTICKGVMSRPYLASPSGITCARMKGSNTHRTSVAADVCLTLTSFCRRFFLDGFWFIFVLKITVLEGRDLVIEPCEWYQFSCVGWIGFV